uniref:Voltage-dependent T-type calcium channel subunit alpha n=1 Tax=Nothobranchius furzeri TaxID=105023 RepID=A0A8C6PLZ0_NOTFU
MAEDGGNLSEAPDVGGLEGRSSLPRTFIRLNDLSGLGAGGGERGELVMEPASPAPDGISTDGDEGSTHGGESLPYPTLAPVVFFYMKQTTRPRSWCLKMVSSMLVILLNCVTLGMFHPCEDINCDSERCKILQDFDDFIFAFFAIEMVIKMVALGIFGKKCYLGDTWNRLDFFIVLAGMLEYSLNLQNVSFSAVRTVRVLRPLRAINRVPSMRILVTLLLDTLPMLGNVLLLCFFVFFIFGIVGVQLWAGLLRNRCFVKDNFSFPLSVELGKYFHTENDDENPFICSMPRDNGMRDCGSIPKLYDEGGQQCNLDIDSYNSTDNTTCVNWNQYYTNCSAGLINPFKGAINFDNICYAWIAIFQVITLEGWVDIMYFVMDAHSFYNFIYFILLIIIGSFFMINLCLVVIATQFSETKQRESQLMKEQRVRFMSNASTLASLSEPGSCYDELLKYLVHIIRKGAKQAAHACRFLARRAGLNIANSPPPTEPQRSQSQRRRRKSSRQGSVSVHHMVHHHHQHHHHHYHLGNGSVRDKGSIRCLDGRDIEAGGHSNNGGGPRATTASGYPALAAKPLLYFYSTHCTTSNTPSNLRTTYSKTIFIIFRCWVVPYPTDLTASASPSDHCFLAAALLSRQLSAHDLSTTSSAMDKASLNLDPEGCPYCAKALANESEVGTEGNEMPGDSDSDGVYEISQDLRDRRDSRQPRKKIRRLGKTAAKAVHFWRLVCDTFRKIVDSKYFGRGIMIAILINTLSMGIEYHEQPEELTNALEISNIVFTSLFSLEMLLKVLVYGPFGYIKNPYNIFDGIIVVISVWEIVGQQGGGLSVLRTFRLMRVLKLVRFMPALQRQLVVLMKTMDNVATFCMLLMLFIFIFSILGMHLFGCKFGSERDGDTLPDRKNFDSLLWAIVTVFQILTQEDWNKVLYNGMASTSPVAALYFIALMTFGNYVLFNLLVAILVEGFQAERLISNHIQTRLPTSFDLLQFAYRGNRSTEVAIALTLHTTLSHLETRGSYTSLTPPLITHTAATPMPVPKLPVTGDPILGYESRQSSNISIDPSCFDKSLTSTRSSPHPPWSSGSGRTSRRSSWNSLGRAPSYKRQKRQSGERRSLLSGEGDSSSNEEEDNTSLPRTNSMPQSRRGSRHRRMESVETRSSLDLPPEALLQVDQLSIYFEILQWMEKKQPEWCRQRDTWSLYLFPQESRSSWNILDGMLVMISVVDILVSLISNTGTKILGMLRVLRLLRTLRPLRVISRAPGLKLVVETLMSSLKPIGNIVVICCAFFIIFGILGVQLFKGKFFVCQGEDMRNVTNKSDCLQANYKWVRHKYNFDNLGQALMSLFVLASKDGWVDIMYDGLDAVGVDQQPKLNNNPWMLLYFISFLLIVAFFVLNMFVGVVVENFHKCRRHQEAEEAKRREEKRLKRMEKKRRKAQSKPYYSDYCPTRLLIHKMCTSHYLDLFITIVIGLNVITMSMEHYEQPQELDNALKICNYIFTLIFVLESVFKLVAFGFRRFFKDKWNQLDLAIVLLSIMGITLEEIEVNASLPINPTIIRIMRVLRIARVLKLLKMAVGMRALLDTVMQALPQVFTLLHQNPIKINPSLSVNAFHRNPLLMCLSEDLHPCEGLGRYATFRNFGMAFLLLFRVSTGDNWNGIMKDTLRDCAQDTGTCYNTVVSPIYFVSFVLTAQFVLVNVVIAVLMKHLEESNKEAKEEAELEAELEMELQMEGAEPPEQLGSGKPLKNNLLSVKKPAVGRTHSLPNDSYMFFPMAPFGPSSSASARLVAPSQEPQCLLGIHRAQSGTDFVSTKVVASRYSCDQKLSRSQQNWNAEDSSSVDTEGYRDYVSHQESSCLRQLKRFHSADTQGRSTFLPRPHPYSWLDDPRRHSVEVCSAEDPSPQRRSTSTSSGFVSQTDSLQIHSQIPAQASLPSPRRKKKMSPPCISVDPPDELEAQSGNTCLRRRAPSSDSKDSFDLGVGEVPVPDGGSPNTKLLTLPSFSFEKTTAGCSLTPEPRE